MLATFEQVFGLRPGMGVNCDFHLYVKQLRMGFKDIFQRYSVFTTAVSSANGLFAKVMQKHILRLLSLLGCLLLLGGSVSYAQTRYWVGNSGSWNDTNHWSLTSGGSPGAAVPVATDAVAFNASSFTAGGQTVTITAGATCVSMDWTGVANTPTLALSNPLTITGAGATFTDNMLVSGTAKITFSSTANVTLNLGNTAKTFGDIEFSAGTVRNVTMNTSTNGAVTQNMGVLTVGNNAEIAITGDAAKVYTGVSFGSNIRIQRFFNSTVNGTANLGGNTVFLGGFYNIENATFNGSFTLGGAFNANFSSSTINGNAFFSGQVGMRSVTMGSSATMSVAAGGNLEIAGNSCTFNTGSVVTVNGSATLSVTSGSHTFNNSFVLNTGSVSNISVGSTFGGNLTSGNSVTATFSGTGSNVFNGDITTGTANNITFSNSGINNYQNVTVGAGSNWRFSTGGTSTVAGSFTTNGTCAAPVNLNSNTGSSQATVTFGAFPNPTNVNVSYLAKTGSVLNILAGTGGNNNANITIPTGRTLFWVGNSGNWNSTANWSTTSGGPATACPPTALDNVIFNAASFTAGSQTVTTTAGAVCNNMTWAAATNNPTLALASDLTIKGTALTLADIMGVSGSGKILFDNTASIAVDLGTGGKNISGGLTFNGTPTRTITLSTNSAAVTHTLGTLVVGGNSTLNVTGTSTKTYTGAVAIGSAGAGVTGSFAGVNTFTGGGNLFGAYNFSGAANLNSAIAFQGTGNNTFAAVNVDATSAAATATFSNTGTNTFASLALTNGTSNAAAISLTTGGTNTVTGPVGALSVSGGCQSARILSSGAGPATLSLSSAQTIAGAIVTNINRTGAGSLTVNNGTNGGGNTGVLFPAVTASRVLRWVGGTGNWNDQNRWEQVLPSALPAPQCPPTISDDVLFNNNSFTAAGQTVTINVDAFCRSMDWSGLPTITRTPILAGTTAQTLTIAGNLNLTNLTTQNFLGTVIFASTATGRTINTAGRTLANVDFNGIGGGWTLNANPLVVTNTVNLIVGALDASGQQINTGILTANNASDLTRSLGLGSATHTISGTGTALDLRGSNFTLTIAASTVSLTGSGAVSVETGSQATLPNFTVAATNVTINTPSTASRVTFGTISASNLPNRTLTVTGTSPKTYGNITIDGTNAAVTFNGSGSASPNNNIFAALTFTDGRTGTNATINGNNTFGGAVSIHGGSGSANGVNFTGTNVFNGLLTARLANTAGTELQFASTGGTNATAFNGAVSLNPGNTVNVNIDFTNATTFNTGANLTVGASTATRFLGTGNNVFQNVTVNHSSTFSLQNSGTAPFASATINSTTGTGLGVTWEFRAGQAATFTGGMAIAAVCGEPVRVRSNTSGTQANVSFGAAQTWNNQVVVNDLNVTAGPVTAYATATAGTPGNNVNVTYPGGSANRTLYWVGGSGNWNTTNAANWSTNSGGTGGACPPTANDHVFFDGASGLGGGTVTVNASPVFCRDMNWTATPANTTFALGTNVLEINGNLTLAPGLVITPNIAPPGLPGLGTSEFRFTNSAAANGTTTGVTARSINTAGTTAALPNVLFNQTGVTWTLNGPAAFNATYRLALRSGTLNTNSVTVNCNNLTTANDNAWVGNANDVARNLTLGNSQVFIRGSNATGTYTNLDLRGNNLTLLPIPGVNARFQFTNSDQYIGIEVGGPAKELPDFLFESDPMSLSAGPRDIDVYTGDGAGRITFRKIKITRELNNTQMAVFGTSPKTYGDITLPKDFNLNDIGQRTFYGTSNTPPNNNIYNGSITAGDNASIRFEGNNTFKNTLNFNPGAGFNGGVIFQNVNTFEANVTIAGTWDVNDAVQFGNAGTTTFASGAILDITANNTNRFTPTVTFGGVANVSPPAIATVGQTTTFNANATFRSAAGTNNSIYRFSGPVTQAVGTTLTIANETIGLFVGDNTYMANPEDNPTTGAATAFGLGGNFVVGAQSRAKFTNNGANTYNTLTIGDYAAFEFSSFNTSTVSGAFNAVGTCNVWKRIAAHVPGDQANVTFNANQAWAFVIVQDINEAAGGGAVTAASSTNVGTPGPSSNTNIAFSGGIPTPGTLVWVGGSAGNNSGNNNWSDPKNWVPMPGSNNPNDITAAQRINGGSCIPSLENDVVFASISFSGPASPSGKFNTVNVDIPEAFCRSMTWNDNVQNGAMLVGDDPINIIRVAGNLYMGDRVDNQFNGIFSFESSTSTRSIDMNGPSASNSATDVESFRGPVQINNVGAVYELQSNIIINATDQGVPAQRRGNLTVVLGELRGLGRDITLTGNWLVQQPAGGNPQGRFLHGNGGTVTFNGTDAVAGPQNIVGATSNFWNIAINRQSNPVPTDITGNDQNIPDQANRWVVIQNRNDLISLDNIGSSNNPDNGGNPGTVANRGSWENGITIERDLAITGGGLYDNGYQIQGNATGTVNIANGTVLSIGHANASAGVLNNAILGTRFPTGYVRGNITLGATSTVSYSANGHQDVSSEPAAYGNLYLRNANPGTADGLNTLTSSSTEKRLSMGSASRLLAINGRLTIEQGILLHDMGSQIGVAAASALTMQTGSTLVIGSGAQTVATTGGTGSNPATNVTGTATLTASATTFPAFTQANIDIHQNSNVVYASSLPQIVRGNLPATGTSGQRYGNLVLVNPTTTTPTLKEKEIQATGPIKVNSLIIHPNDNLVDNGQQINGTVGSAFVMSAATIGTPLDPLGAPFNGQAPTSTGVTSSATPVDLSITHRPAEYGFRFHGFITITNPGTYTFYTSSDDGSMLQVNGTVVVNNNFQQGVTTRSGTIALAAGTYPFTVTFHQGGGGDGLNAEWQCTSCTPSAVPRVQIPASVLRTTQTGVPGALNYSYYEAPPGVNYDANNGNNGTGAATNGGIRAYPDLANQSLNSMATFTGESRLVLGTGTVATLFPANYADADLDFDLTTTIVYNAGLAQTVRGLDNTLGIGGNTPNNSATAVTFTTPQRVYADLVLTNPVNSSPRIAPKTLSAEATVRGTLTINPNNNLIDAGLQLATVPGTTTAAPWNEKFIMRNATLAINPVTNSGTVGTTGESRLTIGTAATATRFPSDEALNTNSTLGFRTGRSSRTDLLLESGTTIVYNSGAPQRVEGFANVAGTTTATYANLSLINPAAAATTPVVKTLQNRATAIRNTLTIFPDNVFADGDFQIGGTAGQAFNMYNATRPIDPADGTTLIGSIGESRLIIGSNGAQARTFPTGYDNADINFETGTTVAYYGQAGTQSVRPLQSATANQNYANLAFTNPDASSPVLAVKQLVSLGGANAVTQTTVRGYLHINPNVDFQDNGLQINGVAGQTLRMRNVTLAENLRGTATLGTAGESRLTLGTAATATTFPSGYTTQNGTDIEFELNTTVVYNAGQAQAVAGVFNSTANSTANYAQLSFVNPGAGTATKTLTNQARVRQNLTIGGVTAAAASGADNLLDASLTNQKIFLQGNWFTHPGNGFHARAGEVELEGSIPQNIRTRNTSAFISEAGTQDFANLVVNNTTAVPTPAVTLGSNVAVSNNMTFTQGLVQSAVLPTYTTAPTDGLLIFRHNAIVSSAKDISFVLGAVRKVGQVASGVFHFPIGVINSGAGFYRPSGVSGISSSTGAFISQYYLQHPISAGFPNLSANIQTAVNGSSQPLINVSAREFWMVNRENGSPTAFVSLSWREPQSGGVGTNSVATNYQGLRVARWDGTLGSSQWRNHGGTGFANYPTGATVGNLIGTLTSQYNTAGTAGAVNNFSPFTLASEITFNPLPVTLLDFKAEAASRQVNLNWQTSTEKNASHFVVERSRDGKTFEKVAQVAANGNTSQLQLYRAVDANPYTGVSYYRLRMVDLDGSEELSKIVKVSIGVAGWLGEISLFPNPTDGRSVNLKLTDPTVKLSSVIDLLGRRVGYRTSFNTDGSVAVEFTETLAKGAYVATLISADGSQTTRIKFVVQ